MTEPKCPYFGKCGGCAMQHVPYDIQLENKRHTLFSALRGQFPLEDIKAFADEEYFYRNRMDMVFHKAGLGFRKKGDWKSIVSVEKCMISNDRLNALIAEITDFFGYEIDAFDVVKKSGTFRYALIRTPANDSLVGFVLNQDSTRLDAAIQKIEAFARKTTARNVLVIYVKANSGASLSDDFFVVKGADQLEAGYLGKTFYFAAQGFFQNNDVMAEKMHTYVHDLLATYDTQKAHLLDLYGGVGTFGILNADLFDSVTTLEVVEACTQAAQHNIQLNAIANMKAVCADAKFLKNHTFPRPLFVITDPPRSGMNPKTIQILKKWQPEVLIYVSCNVKQLSKDIPKFPEYTLKSAAVFDLFPQTHHMESVVELVRR